MSEQPDTVRGVVAGDVEAALGHAANFFEVAGQLGRNTGEYFGVLRQLGAFDLTTARALEPHLDALTIVHEAGVSLEDLGADRSSTWGVFASRAPGLRAEQTGDSWALTGEKPWCSLADKITHALVTAGTPDGQRIFAVSMRDASVQESHEKWVSRGLSAIRSTGVSFKRTPAIAVGEAGFYLSRSGFAWGGIGVAAIWAGAVDALISTLHDSLSAREPDQIAFMHRGRLDAQQHVLDTVLAQAAADIDAGRADGAAGSRLGAQVRAIVAHIAEDALVTVGHALGPGPLVGDEAHARRVADLTVYVRQHHAERDLARLGEMTVAE